jgi:hypothetical protein
MPLGDVGGWFKQPMQAVEPMEPVPDQPTGHNFPYRGGEQHGVAPTGPEYNPAEQWQADQAVQYQEEEEHTIRPVPVRIVQESTREFKGFSTGTVQADSTPRMIAGRHDRRHSVRIRNNDAAVAILIGTSMVNTVSGWTVAPGDTETLNTDQEVYAISADGTAVSVSILQEFSVQV